MPKRLLGRCSTSKIPSMNWTAVYILLPLQKLYANSELSFSRVAVFYFLVTVNLNIIVTEIWYSSYHQIDWYLFISITQFQMFLHLTAILKIPSQGQQGSGINIWSACSCLWLYQKLYVLGSENNVVHVARSCLF